MTCVATQEGTIKLIRNQFIQLAKKLNNERSLAILGGISKVSERGLKEIENGGITPGTCESVSVVMWTNEMQLRSRILASSDSEIITFYTGLKIIHASMNLLVPDTGSEGPIPCEPYCK